MDPRTAAKVTAPDLLKAFTEGTGREPGDEAVAAGNTVWVIFTDGDDVVNMVTLEPGKLDLTLPLMLGDVAKHLGSGENKGVLFFAGTEEPPIVDDARKAISDGSGN